MTGRLALWQVAAVISGCALGAMARAQLPDTGIDVLSNRGQLLATYERMPRDQLERVFMRCDAESSSNVLGFQEGVLCAMAWDALLQREFGGDVQALLTWWRAQREARPASAQAGRY